MCKLARQWSGGTLPSPIAEAELPSWSINERPDDVRSSELAAMQALLRAAAAQDERIGTFGRVVAATGMRRGMACTLRWSDIDVGGVVVMVDEPVISAGHGGLPVTVWVPDNRGTSCS